MHARAHEEIHARDIALGLGGRGEGRGDGDGGEVLLQFQARGMVILQPAACPGDHMRHEVDLARLGMIGEALQDVAHELRIVHLQPEHVLAV